MPRRRGKKGQAKKVLEILPGLLKLVVNFFQVIELMITENSTVYVVHMYIIELDNYHFFTIEDANFQIMEF